MKPLARLSGGLLGAFVVLVLVLVLPGHAFAASPTGARALEARLYAPCCYGGTLDIHESELARTLRGEIEARLARGETTDAIQADFVERYGEQVLAARSATPIRDMGAFLLGCMALAAVGVGALARRWTRPRADAVPARSASREPDELDARLDAELADLDA